MRYQTHKGKILVSVVLLILAVALQVVAEKAGYSSYSYSVNNLEYILYDVSPTLIPTIAFTLLGVVAFYESIASSNLIFKIIYILVIFNVSYLVSLLYLALVGPIKDIFV